MEWILTAVGISTVALLASYYWILVAQRPKLYVRNSRMKKFLKNHLPILNERYCPPPFYWDGNIQTALSVYQRQSSQNQLKFKLHVLPLSDGGQLGLETIEPKKPNKNDVKPVVVLLLPGAGSGSDVAYMQTLVKAIQSAGATTIAFNNRGFAGVRLTTPRTHSGRYSDDLREVVQHVKKVYPNHTIVVGGISLGALIICHYLIDYPEEAKEAITSVYLISTVWHYYNAMLNLEKSIFNRLINKSLTTNFRDRILVEKEILEPEDCFDWSAVANCGSVREFETAVTVLQHGYASLHDYWTDCILKGKTHKFPVPVFSLNAQDDPMIPGQDLPIEEALADASNLALIVTNRGGHIGFLEGISPMAKETHYMERFTTQLIQAFVSHSHELKL